MVAVEEDRKSAAIMPSLRHLVGSREDNGGYKREVLQSPSVIQIQDLDVAYQIGGPGVKQSLKPSLKGVSFDLPEHAITAIIGPSGVGKSTLLRVLNGMYGPTRDSVDGKRRPIDNKAPVLQVRGRAYLQGMDLFQMDEVDRRQRFIGIVFQKSESLHGSIFDNVATGLRMAGMKDKAQIQYRVQEALKEVYLWDEVHQRLNDSPSKLSGGQLQRMCVARALVLRPTVLLLDEPASALDPIATKELETTLVRLKENQTILIVTHNMQQAARISDAVGVILPEITEANGQQVIGPGCLEEFGTVGDIFLRPQNQRVEAFIEGRGM